MANENNQDEAIQSNEIDTDDLDPSIDDLLGDYDDIESIINLLDNGKDSSADADTGGASTASAQADSMTNKESDASGSGKIDKKTATVEKKEAKKKAKEEKRLAKERAKEEKRAEKEKKKREGKESKKKPDLTKEEEVAAILQDTGSTAEDMAKLSPEEDIMEDSDGVDAESLLGQLEGLDNIEDLDEKLNQEASERAQREKEELAKKKKEEKAAKKKEKAELKKAKAAQKKAEKEKKKKEKQKKEKAPRSFEPEEKIKVSAVGIAFIITIVALVVFCVYFGSGYYQYQTNIKNASKYYLEKDYEKAYDTLVGMDLKPADEGLYRQVVNIIYVKKHINDFEAFVSAEMYSSALEALLRGIESYDESIMTANELGTTEALGEVLNETVDCLQRYYGINLDEARNLLLNEGSQRSALINEKAAAFVIPEPEPEPETLPAENTPADSMEQPSA